MLRIAIADDEDRIRNGLAKLIAAASPQYEVAGTFSNGEELLHYVEEHGADLVITDIRMPVMTGLEVAQRLAESHPDTRCVILSGYSDFEYARTAFRCKVTDYLLKPIEKKELYRILRQIDETRSSEMQQQSSRRGERLERYLLSGGAEPEALLLSEKAVWMAVRMEKQLDRQLLLQYLQHLDMSSFDVVCLDDKLYALLFHVDDKEGLAERVLAALLPYTEASIGISRMFGNVHELKAACEEAAHAAWAGVYEFECSTIRHSDAACGTSRTASSEFIRNWETSFIRSLEVVERQRIEQALTELFQWLRSSKLPFMQVEERFSWMMFTASRVIKEYDEAAIKQGLDGITNWKSHLQAAYKFNEFVDWFIRQFMDIIDDILESRSGSVRSIDHIKAMIKQQYQEELDLTSLAESVYLTPSYVSKLFKQETGMTITDYLIMIRIEEAKRLLRERADLKTYEIGERVGYQDPAYFTKIFKRTTGKTPNEFRRHC